ncbi:FKBP-type peptidyl-prolyl cis-trans isomerase [Mycobacterium sp. AMU20-3851]|uniref:FKBP-type peptidyl-prolyl cis-trans isomerase n=1 Tax=Mycobacterium sp. AMU20-3851 TaxID=3122055 RepID=UPI00375514FD
MNCSRVPSSIALLAGAAAIAMTVSACGSDTQSAASTSSATTTADAFDLPASDVAPVASPCPSAAPEAPGAPEWTLSGATGSVAVTGSTDTAAPVVDVDGPFSVTETQVQTLKAGDGPVVPETATVSVCYMGVNGRDGNVFDSSYQTGAPVDFPLDGVIPGFQKAIAGQKVGSTVAVAMTSEDGYAEGQPAAGIEKGDTLIFAIKILEASN